MCLQSLRVLIHAAHTADVEQCVLDLHGVEPLRRQLNQRRRFHRHRHQEHAAAAAGHKHQAPDSAIWLFKWRHARAGAAVPATQHRKQLDWRGLDWDYARDKLCQQQLSAEAAACPAPDVDSWAAGPGVALWTWRQEHGCRSAWRR